MARSRRYLLADLSNNNSKVNLARVRDAGVTGLWHKVSEGFSFTDDFWSYRHEAARSLGLRVGGYHFARPGHPDDAVQEAWYFVKALGPIKRRDLAPVLDLETTGGLSAKQLEQWARRWMQTVHGATGIWPLFYSFPSFIENMRADRVIGRGLWLASYGRNDGSEHPYTVPRPFKKALAHQFTSRAKLAGVSGNCDLSSAPKLYPLLARGLRGL